MSASAILLPEALPYKVKPIAIDGMPIEMSLTDVKLNELKDHILASVESNLKNIGITEDEIKNAKTFIDLTCQIASENEQFPNRKVNTARFAIVLCTVAEITARHGLFRSFTEANIGSFSNSKFRMISSFELVNDEKKLAIILHEDRDGILFRAQSYPKDFPIIFSS